MCVLKNLTVQHHLVLPLALLALPWPGNAFPWCATSSATMPCTPDVNFQLYSHMEDALVHNKEALFKLRELFFPTLHTERLDSLVKFIKISVTILRTARGGHAQLCALITGSGALLGVNSDEP